MTPQQWYIVIGCLASAAGFGLGWLCGSLAGWLDKPAPHPLADSPTELEKLRSEIQAHKEAINHSHLEVRRMFSQVSAMFKNTGERIDLYSGFPEAIRLRDQTDQKRDSDLDTTLNAILAWQDKICSRLDALGEASSTQGLSAQLAVLEKRTGEIAQTMERWERDAPLRREADRQNIAARLEIEDSRWNWLMRRTHNILIRIHRLQRISHPRTKRTKKA